MFIFHRTCLLWICSDTVVEGGSVGLPDLAVVDGCTPNILVARDGGSLIAVRGRGGFIPTEARWLNCLALSS